MADDIKIESMVTITGAEYVRLIAENAKLRAALEELIWYTNQLELDVYDPKEWPDEHSAVTQARAALGGDT